MMTYSFHWLYIDLHGRVLAELPRRAVEGRGGRFCPLGPKTATALLVGHAGVLDGGMDVALVAGDDLRATSFSSRLRYWILPLLLSPMTRTVARNSKSFTEPPRRMRKLLFAMASGVGLVPMTVPFSTFGRIAVPAGEVFAVEEWFEVVIGGEPKRMQSRAKRNSQHHEACAAPQRWEKRSHDE